ncbi:DUF937 domain-containing protein [Sphingomonas sp.]|uniref:DUF937 domain-containing protein n=1 Tax=Sphingomonas sp. TaxID=28214 RepID=UPI00286D028D|nr:DUF937 domain-containing protein [Sphingomonas sp.]
MDINQMLQQTNAIGAISRELGIDPATAEAGAAALMPSILSGIQQPAAPAALAPADQSADVGSASALGGLGGLGRLLETISSLGGGALLDNVTSNEPTEVDKGNQILGQIFGSKDGSRAVAAQAAAQSGVEPSLLKKMLPMLAMAAAGYVMKNASHGEGGLGGMLGGLLGGEPATHAGGKHASQQEDILGSLIGAAGKYLGR